MVCSTCIYYTCTTCTCIYIAYGMKYMYIHSLLYEVHVYIAQMSKRRNKVMVMLRWGYDVKRTARVEVKFCVVLVQPIIFMMQSVEIRIDVYIVHEQSST